MPAPAWEINEPFGHLQGGKAAAELNLARPQRGLENVSVDGHLLPASILAVRLPEVEGDETLAVADAFVRGADLVVSYAQHPLRSIQPQIYWRGLKTNGGRALLALEIVVSVQTNLLDSRPEVVVCSHLPAHGAWRLARLQPSELKQVRLREDEPRRFSSADGPSCFVFRLQRGDQYSYAQMLPPADAAESTVVRHGDGRVRIEHRLFPASLEKGVILRARVRGLLMPRRQDASQAIALYRDLLKSPLPLTT